jgi:hypothetical protein
LRCRPLAALIGVLALAAFGPSLASARAATDPPADAEAELAAFLAERGARTVCLRLDHQSVEGSACFDVHQVAPGANRRQDFYVWQMVGGAKARVGRHLTRVKLRLSSPDATTDEWRPDEDRVVREDTPVTIRLPAAHVFVRFDLPAGRLHPWIFSDRLYHVSWLDPDGQGLACCRRAEVGGFTEWVTAEGAPMRAKLQLEASYR